MPAPPRCSVTLPMMLSLLHFVLLFPAAYGLPPIQIRDSPITVPIAARINSIGVAKFVEADKARALRIIKGVAERVGLVERPTGVDITDTGVSYTVEVGVGYPESSYTLIIDTGSSNTWIGANKTYTPTFTSTKTNDTVKVKYGGDNASTVFFSGTEYIDRLTIGSRLVIDAQSIGVASNSSGFAGQGVDGILGIGPVDLTLGTLSNTSKLIPTVTENLYKHGAIKSEEVGISFEPTTSIPVTNGELTFGGADPSKFTGDITYAPITSTKPATKYWGVDQSIRYGDSTNIMSSTSGIVDTGTSLILIASDAFSAYQNATGAVLDKDVGLLRLTEAQFSKLQSLFFTIGGTTFELTANAQAWPRSQNSVIGGADGSVYLVVSDTGTPSGQGLDFLNGFAFLQRFYTIYDTGNSRVGFATTPFTYATTN